MSQIFVEISAKEHGLLQTHRRIVQQQAEMTRGYGRVGNSAAQAGRQARGAGRSASGGWDTGQILRFAGALAGGLAGGLSIVGALRGVIGLAREAQAEVKGIAEGLKETYEGIQQLWQISESDAQYKSLSGKYKLAMAREGIGRRKAQDLTFTLGSFDELGALPTVTKAARYMDPAVAANFVARTRAPTAWGKDVGTPRQLLSGLSRGAARSGYNAAQTAEWLTPVASQWATMGASLDEVLGVGAAVSPAFKGDATNMSTGMRNLEKVLTAWRMKAVDEGTVDPDEVKGLMATFEAFRRLDPEEYKNRVMSDVRFKSIATSLEKPETLKLVDQFTKEIASARTTGGDFDQKISESRPKELTQQQMARRAAAMKELGLENRAKAQLDLQTLIDLNKAAAGAADKPLTIEKGWEKALETQATMGNVRGATSQAMGHLAGQIQAADPALYDQLVKRIKPTTQTVGDPLGGTTTQTHWPAELSQEHAQAFQDAMQEIMERLIDDQTDFAPARDQAKERAKAGAAKPARPLRKAADPMEQLAWQQIAARIAEGRPYKQLPAYQPGMENMPEIQDLVRQHKAGDFDDHPGNQPAEPIKGPAKIPKPAKPPKIPPKPASEWDQFMDPNKRPKGGDGASLTPPSPWDDFAAPPSNGPGTPAAGDFRFGGAAPVSPEDRLKADLDQLQKQQNETRTRPGEPSGLPATTRPEQLFDAVEAARQRLRDLQEAPLASPEQSLPMPGRRGGAGVGGNMTGDELSQSIKRDVSGGLSDDAARLQKEAAANLAESTRLLNETLKGVNDAMRKSDVEPPRSLGAGPKRYMKP